MNCRNQFSRLFSKIVEDIQMKGIDPKLHDLALSMG
jgi:hypothetical protein